MKFEVWNHDDHNWGHNSNSNGPLLYNFPKLDIFSVKFRFLLHRIVHKKSFHTVLTIFWLLAKFSIFWGFKVRDMTNFALYNLESLSIIFYKLFFIRKFKGCSIRALSFKLIRTPTQKILRRQKYIIFSQISPILSQFETKTTFSSKSSTTNSIMIFSETNDDRKLL